MDKHKTRLGCLYALSRHIRGFGWYLFFAVVSNLIFKLLPLLTGLTTSFMVGSVLMGDTGRVRHLLMLSGALVLLQAAFSYLDVQVSHDMAYRILASLRDQCYEKLDEIAPAAMASKRSGDVISIVLNDVETLEWFYAHTIGQLAVAILIPLSALVFMGTFSIVLPAVLLPFIALLIYIPKRTAAYSDEQGAQVKETMGTLSAIIVDGVQGLKDILSFRWQQEYFRRFIRSNKAYADASLAYASRRGKESSAILLIMGIASLSSDVAAAVLVASGRIPALWLLPLFVTSSAVFVPILDALNMSTNYGLIVGAARRVLGLFAMQPMVKDNGTLSFLDTGSTTVSFQDVVFSYPPDKEGEESVPVLKGLSFSFHTGETVALVGASGSGKTTAARLLQRFFDVDGGAITLNGVDVRQLSLHSLRENVTVVPQDVYLFNISVEDNLRMAKGDVSLRALQSAAQSAQAADFIKKLPEGWKTRVGEQGLRLSGGEKQRLSIAQAFLKDAPVLVLDEASANLDAENERLINQAVEAVKQGRATLVIAHRLSTIRAADRIVVLNEGKKEDEGTYTELIARCPYFAKLVGEEYEGESDAES